LKGLGGLLIGVVVLYCGVFHLCLRIPLRQLLAPLLLHSLLGVLGGPFLYWSLKHETLSAGDRRPFFLAVAVIGLLGCLLLLYYGWKLGLVSGTDFRGLSVTILIVLPPGAVVGYYLAERIYPSPYRHRGSQVSDTGKRA
jgi:hypothetical protein